MDRRSLWYLVTICALVMMPLFLSAQQAPASSFQCGSPVLSPYGPIAECKYSINRDLPEPTSFGENTWAGALSFVLSARGFSQLGHRLAGAVDAVSDADPEEVLQWASSRWSQDDGKTFKIEAQFARLDEFSSWVSPGSFPVLIRTGGTPSLLISADLSCNRQSERCDYVSGVIYSFDTGQTQPLSLTDWKLAGEFVRLDVLTDASTDEVKTIPGTSEVSLRTPSAGSAALRPVLRRALR